MSTTSTKETMEHDFLGLLNLVMVVLRNIDLLRHCNLVVFCCCWKNRLLWVERAEEQNRNKLFISRIYGTVLQ